MDCLTNLVLFILNYPIINKEIIIFFKVYYVSNAFRISKAVNGICLCYLVIQGCAKTCSILYLYSGSNLVIFLIKSHKLNFSFSLQLSHKYLN